MIKLFPLHAIQHVKLVMLTDVKKQPYMEQAAQDKVRAEQEKSEYEVRTIGCRRHCIAMLIRILFQNKNAGSGDGEDDEE
jgi:hypothetical protein